MCLLLIADAEQLGHLIVKESLPGFIGLDPLAVHDELRDGAFSGMGDDLFGGARGSFDVDLCIRNGVFGKEPFGFATVAAPVG